MPQFNIKGQQFIEGLRHCSTSTQNSFDMHRIIALTAICIFTSNFSNGQSLSYNWGKSYVGNHYAYTRAITTDTNGNVYATGLFSDTCDFDPSGSSFVLVPHSQTDAFITKHDSNGNFLWVKQFGGIWSVNSWGITIDKVGNILATGYFRDSVDFNPGVGVHNLISAGMDDIFILKLNPNGGFIWAKSMGNTNLDRGRDIVTDTHCNVYTTGYFSGSVDFDPNQGSLVLTAEYADAYIQKLDSSGSLVWVKQLKASGMLSEIHGYSINLDQNNNVYSTGYFGGTVDFDPSNSTFNLESEKGRSVFVQKLDVNGNFLWARRFGGLSDAEGLSIKTDYKGNVFTTGHFFGAGDFNPGVGPVILTPFGNVDIFVHKMNAIGDLKWVKQLGGPERDYPQDSYIDADGNHYVCGNFEGSIDLDPNSGTHILSPTSVNDGFVQKLNPSGNFVWAGHLVGSEIVNVHAVNIDSRGNVIAGGGYRDSIDLDPTQGTDIFVKQNGTFELDGYITKWSQCKSSEGFDTVSACKSFLWDANNQTYESSGVFTTNISNSTVCDSIVTLNLSITQINAQIDLSFNEGTHLLSTFDSSAYNYQWINCANNSLVDNANQSSFTPENNDSYAVIVTLNGCSDTSECVPFPLGLDKTIANSVSVFPNPAQNTLIIRRNSRPLNDLGYRLYTLEGVLLESRSFPSRTDDIQLDLSGYSSGLYMLEVIAASNSTIFRILKL